MHTPFLFNYAGNAHAQRTQYWVQKNLRVYYPDGPNGVPGNDDYGALSAWCVWAHIGLYPITPTADYAVFTPLFDAINVTLPAAGPAAAASPWRKGGLVLQVTAAGRCPGGTEAVSYVASVTLNGAALKTPVVSHAALMNGVQGGATRLHFQLSCTPSVFGDSL
jgi:putative alpha-1,2-mannosidase